MNEKSLEVLNQYDMKVHRTARGRGGIIVTTDRGDKLLLECVRQDKYYEREDCITGAVRDCGFENVDTYVRNADGKLISELAEDGRKYVVKDMYQGSECNVKNVKDISRAVDAMARLHEALHSASPVIASAENTFILARGNIADVMVRHAREMKMASNYLRTKKKKSEYEMSIYRNIGEYYEEAMHAVELTGEEEVRRGISRADETGELIHGSFSYHNVVLASQHTAVTNLEKCRIDTQMWDLYQFMRKILEKNGWDIAMAYMMINEYDKRKTISDEEVRILAVLFAFPEKFWKITNHYYNMNKAWVPPKSIEKLEECVRQNGKRREFLATIGAL